MIFVTTGHVDHRKTALLQALTGTHTAHLPEEKKRGLTIDLGYAYLPIAGDTLGFIDVPGHQKFLSNMLAGLGGVQYALLVISAQEEIKPKTQEHLTLLRLLHFSQIMVVITKADTAFSLLLPIQARRIETLKQHLIRLKQQDNLLHRYAIDRVFHLKGAGVVVTGTEPRCNGRRRRSASRIECGGGKRGN